MKRRKASNKNKSLSSPTSRLPFSGRGLFEPALTVQCSNQLSAFPPRVTRTLRYVQTGTVDVANFGINAQVFRANSLYDPDFTGTGHQPNGFDQIMAAYNHFTVIGAKIRVSLRQLNTGGGTVEPGTFVLAFSDTGTLVASQTSLEGMLEKRTVLCFGTYSATGQIASASAFEGYLSVSRLLGKSQREIVEMANLRGNAAANPSEGYFFELGFFSVSNNPGAITYCAEIEYTAVFTEPVANFGDS